MNRRLFIQQLGATIAFLTASVRVKAALPPKDNSSYWKHRISDETPEDWKRIEKALADEWAEWNDPKRYGGMGILQDLMLGTYKLENPEEFDPWVSDRERKIVATIVQWMGTNVGRSFLAGVNKRLRVTHFPFERSRKDALIAALNEEKSE